MAAEMNMPYVEFQDELTRLGGRNRYDEPNFRLWWGEYGYGDGSFRAGGVWSVDESYFLGYRDLLRSGEACWCLGQWHDAVEYGTPESFYVSNYDDATNLQILGEYPYSGRTELLYALRWFERVDEKLIIHPMPLNYEIFERLIPIILMAKNISVEKTRAAHEEIRRREEDEKTAGIERHLRDHADPFRGNAVSFSRQGIRSTVIDQKMLEMQRQWNQLANSAKQFRKGIQTR